MELVNLIWLLNQLPNKTNPQERIEIIEQCEKITNNLIKDEYIYADIASRCMDAKYKKDIEYYIKELELKPTNTVALKQWKQSS